MKIKKIRWQIISLLVIILTVNIAFAGCNQTEKPVSNEKSFVKLKMVYPTNPAAIQDQDMVMAEINKYLKDKLNCELVVEPMDGATYNQKVPLMLQASEDFDIMWLSSAMLLQNAANNGFLQINDLLDKYGTGIKQVVPDYALKGTQLDGRQYALPVHKEYAGAGAMYAREDIVNKYNFNLKDMKTFTDLDPIFETIKTNEPQLVPLFIGKGSWLPPLPINEKDSRYLDLNGLPNTGCRHTLVVFDPDTDKICNYYDTKEALENMRAMSKWNKLGYINKDSFTVNESSFDAVKNGKTWAVYSSAKPGMEAALSQELGYKMIRAYEQEPQINGAVGMGSMTAIPSASKNPERAMMLLDLLYTDKNLINLFNFGLEGKHYIKVNDNVIKLPDGCKTPMDTGYAPGIDWRLGNNFNLYVWNYDDPNKYIKLKEFNDRGKKTQLVGFLVNIDEVKTQIATVNNVLAEYDSGIEAGLFDPDDINKKVNDKLKSAGIDKIVDCVQKQYDKWKASKQY